MQRYQILRYFDIFYTMLFEMMPSEQKYMTGSEDKYCFLLTRFRKINVPVKPQRT